MQPKTTTTWKDNIPVGKSYSYGFDQIELECEQADGEDALSWQIDTEAFPDHRFAESGTYSVNWYGLHPGRMFRQIMEIGFDAGMSAFIVVSHA